MIVIESIHLLVARVQAVCIYLNKSLQALLCNTHAFALPSVYLCRIKPFKVEVEFEVEVGCQTYSICFTLACKAIRG